MRENKYQEQLFAITRKIDETDKLSSNVYDLTRKIVLFDDSKATKQIFNSFQIIKDSDNKTILHLAKEYNESLLKFYGFQKIQEIYKKQEEIEGIQNNDEYSLEQLLDELNELVGLEKVKEKGVNIAHVTLHVGLGTFRPVKVDDVESHHMHSEFYIVEEDQAKLINDTKKAGKRVIAVGTTSCRTLESATGEDGILKSGSGWTEIFIYPGYHFKMIDALITNFHLPESTLVMLVSALAGKENIMHAYETAVQEKYRFFSFGDAMIII